MKKRYKKNIKGALATILGTSLMISGCGANDVIEINPATISSNINQVVSESGFIENEKRDSEAANDKTKVSEASDDKDEKTEASEASDDTDGKTEVSEKSENDNAESEDAEASGDDGNRECINQVSLLQGLTFGDYNGTVPVSKLKKLGDTGIGTFDALNGELIMLDGEVYRAAGDGSVEVVPDDELIPFSDVTFFDDDESYDIQNVKEINDIKTSLNERVEQLGRNNFYAVKIVGTFKQMNVRSELSQTEPYKPLATVLETDQTFFDYEDISGTVVGLYCPDYMKELNAVGWHFHFISDDKTKGGHVLDFSTDSAVIKLDQTQGFAMVLPDNDMFKSFDFTIDQTEDIKKVETGEDKTTAEEPDTSDTGSIETRDFYSVFRDDDFNKDTEKEILCKKFYDYIYDGSYDDGIKWSDYLLNGRSAASHDAESAVVSYLGPEGTYTQEACGVFFDKKGTYLPYKTVSDAIDALENGESSYAVIPQENTIGGAVTDYLDILIEHPDISVVGEVVLPINQNLLVLPGTRLTDIKKVYSHKQGIAQSREWLEKNVPDAEIIEVSSTAEGAKMVAEDKDKSQAAIASAACADIYGLDLLAEGIQNNDINKTRFYVLSMDDASTETRERMAFIASGSAENLPDLMAELKALGLDLVTIHERPAKTELGNYNYIIECDDGDYKQYKKLTKNRLFDYRYLGSYDVC